MNNKNFIPEVIDVNCVTIDELNAICKRCKKKLYIWFEIKVSPKDKYKLCLECRNCLMPDAPDLDYQTLNDFFLVLFDASILLKRIGDLLLVTNTNKRTIEGGLISRELKLQNLKPLIDAGVKESLIRKALEYSDNYGKKI